MLARRDRATETQLLFMLLGINYVLLQRDWSAPRHGDLDLAVDSTDWPRLVRTIVSFCRSNDICIAKAYEIERAIVCVVLITKQGYVQIDAAISPQRREIFGVSLLKALESRELVAGAYVLTPQLAKIYQENKHRYKASSFQRFIKRIINGPIIARRIIEGTLIKRGAIIYTPYVREASLLRSECISTWATDYLQTSLLKRYQAETGLSD
jgi:hypothetical protein